MPLSKTFPSPTVTYEGVVAAYPSNFRVNPKSREITWKGIFTFQGHNRALNQPIDGDIDADADSKFVSSPPVVQVAKIPAPTSAKKKLVEQVKMLEKWEGVVLYKESSWFQARLYRNHSDFPTKLARFEMSILSDEDRAQVDIGGSFVWTISMRKVNGTSTRESHFYFRRLVWSQAEIEATKQKAGQLRSKIAWE